MTALVLEKLAAPVTVLHQGKIFKQGDIQTLRDDPEVIAIYLGRAKRAERAAS